MSEKLNEKQQIIALLMQYLPAFPSAKTTTPKEQDDWQKRFVIYATVLQGTPLPAINAAMIKLCKTCKFYPSVAEICEQVESVQEYTTDSRLPSPDEAWHEAMREAHDKFVYKEWELSTPEIKQAVDNFGKMALCELTPEGMNTARAQFMRIYSAICDRKKERKANENVLKTLPQRHVEMLVGGLAEKKALSNG